MRTDLNVDKGILLLLVRRSLQTVPSFGVVDCVGAWMQSFNLQELMSLVLPLSWMYFLMPLFTHSTQTVYFCTATARLETFYKERDVFFFTCLCLFHPKESKSSVIFCAPEFCIYTILWNMNSEYTRASGTHTVRTKTLKYILHSLPKTNGAPATKDCFNVGSAANAR